MALHRSRAVTVCLVAVALGAGACVRAAEPAAQAGQSQNGQPVQSQVGEGSGGAPAAAVPVDQQLRHPNGTVVRVTGVSTSGNNIGVDFEATNGFTQQIELNSYPAVLLIDDQGNEYNYTEAPENSTLRVSSGATLSGTLVFLGPLQRGATALELRFNLYADEEFDIAEGFDQSSNPGFLFRDLPVPAPGG